MLGRTTIWLSAWLMVILPAAMAWADPATQPLIKRLDKPTQVKVLAALAGLVILGFGMVALIWLGARMTQRYRNSTPCHRPTPRPGEHDWAKKPLDEGRTD